VLSRAAAIKASKGRSIRREMEDRGVLVMSAAKGTLAEEIPEAYKDIDEVVNVVHGAGLSRKVARLRAVGCIKG
jgi:tRNA-splicing ligase RtcB